MNSSKKDQNDIFHNNFCERENSNISNIFYSQIISIFICECKCETYSFQKIMDLPLLFPGENKNIFAIEYLLKYYFKEEKVKFEEKCPICNKIVIHSKIIRFTYLPEILIVTLQRINPLNKTKNFSILTFEESLNLDNYVDREWWYTKKAIYDLFGVINHIGSIEFWHYYSFIKLFNKGMWYEFNDMKVNILDDKIINFNDAYTLFYKRREN